MYKNRGEDPQWERTEYLSVRKNGKGTERPHVDIPWTCCSSAGGLNVEWVVFVCFFFLRCLLSGQCNGVLLLLSPFSRV